VTPHQEREVALTVECRAVERTRDQAVAKLEAELTRAKDAAIAELARLRSAHDEARTALSVQLRREAHAALLAIARAYAVEPSRQNAIAFAEEWRAHDAEHRNECGANLHDLAFLVFADVALSRDPGAISALYSAVTSPSGLSTDPIAAVTFANGAFLQGDPKAIQTAVEGLELSVSRAAAGNRGHLRNVEEYWRVLHDYTGQGRTEELARLRQTHKAADLAEQEIDREDIRRVRRGQQPVRARAAEWIRNAIESFGDKHPVFGDRSKSFDYSKLADDETPVPVGQQFGMGGTL
jgi:hypothetical protein